MLVFSFLNHYIIYARSEGSQNERLPRRGEKKITAKKQKGVVWQNLEMPT